MPARRCGCHFRAKDPPVKQWIRTFFGGLKEVRKISKVKAHLLSTGGNLTIMQQ